LGKKRDGFREEAGGLGARAESPKSTSKGFSLFVMNLSFKGKIEAILIGFPRKTREIFYERAGQN
jgi:hypothetical protein